MELNCYWLALQLRQPEQREDSKPQLERPAALTNLGADGPKSPYQLEDSRQQLKSQPRSPTYLALTDLNSWSARERPPPLHVTRGVRTRAVKMWLLWRRG